MKNIIDDYFGFQVPIWMQSRKNLFLFFCLDFILFLFIKTNNYPNEINLQNTSFFSEILGKNIKLKVTSKGIKTVEKNGGIDKFLLNSKNSKLNNETRKLKKILASKTS